ALQRWQHRALAAHRRAWDKTGRQNARGRAQLWQLQRTNGLVEEEVPVVRKEQEEEGESLSPAVSFVPIQDEGVVAPVPRMESLPTRSKDSKRKMRASFVKQERLRHLLRRRQEKRSERVAAAQAKVQALDADERAMLQEIFDLNASTKDHLMGLEVHRAVLEAGLVGHTAPERRAVAWTCRPPGQWEEDGLCFAEFAGKIVPSCRQTLVSLRQDKMQKALTLAPREWTGRVQRSRLLEAARLVLPADFPEMGEDYEDSAPEAQAAYETVRQYADGEGSTISDIVMKMQSLSEVVTGAGSGIGRALSLALAARGVYVLAVGRRPKALAETCELAKTEGQMEALAADVSAAAGRAAVASRAKELCEGAPLSCVVHNAAVVGELGTVEQLSEEGFRQTMAINVEGPLFMTRDLLPLLTSSKGRVLHISSGAAHRPLEGCLEYCTSKAALFMVMRALDEELSPSGVRVGSVMPGVVDTPMQSTLRAGDFASVDYFKNLGTSSAGEFQGPQAPPKGLDHPENVAAFLSWLLLEVPPAEFGGREWNIGEWYRGLAAQRRTIQKAWALNEETFLAAGADLPHLDAIFRRVDVKDRGFIHRDEVEAIFDELGVVPVSLMQKRKTLGFLNEQSGYDFPSFVKLVDRIRWLIISQEDRQLHSSFARLAMASARSVHAATRRAMRRIKLSTWAKCLDDADGGSEQQSSLEKAVLEEADLQENDESQQIITYDQLLALLTE
ncbi:unnamed protein product, partial [Effrenium voratum]